MLETGVCTMTETTPSAPVTVAVVGIDPVAGTVVKTVDGVPDREPTVGVWMMTRPVPLGSVGNTVVVVGRRPEYPLVTVEKTPRTSMRTVAGRPLLAAGIVVVPAEGAPKRVVVIWAKAAGTWTRTVVKSPGRAGLPVDVRVTEPGYVLKTVVIPLAPGDDDATVVGTRTMTV